MVEVVVGADASRDDVQDETLPFGAHVDASGRLVVGHRVWEKGSGGPAHLRAFDAEGAALLDVVDPGPYERASTWTFLPLPDGGFAYVGEDPGPSGIVGAARITRVPASFAGSITAPLAVPGDDQVLVAAAVSAKDGHVLLSGYGSSDVSGRIWDLRADLSVAARFAKGTAPVLPDAHTITGMLELPSGDLVLTWLRNTPGSSLQGFSVARVTRSLVRVWQADLDATGQPIQSAIALLPGPRVAFAGFVSQAGSPTATVAVIEGDCLED